LRKLIVPASTVAALVAATFGPASASAWAPAGAATIRPGVMTFTNGGQCTSNFVFAAGQRVYLGQAAHCAGTGAATETDGCDSGSLPLGTPVEVAGATRPGTLAYSSWLTMQARGESNPNACAYNDFALVRIAPADVGRVNPSVPGFGGPTGVGTAGGLGSAVYSYGNSSLRGGVTKLSPKRGVIVRNQGAGWSHNAYTATPGIPGDSGSGFENASGQAIGVLSTVEVLPAAGSNNFGDLGRELAYMHANSPLAGVHLVRGTRPFNPNLAGAILGS
jgi:hypothetical protein